MLRMDYRMNLDCISEDSDEEKRQVGNLVNFYHEADSCLGSVQREASNSPEVILWSRIWVRVIH